MTQQASSDALAMMKYDANKKSAGLAYVLWFFLGGLGVHRFYLGSTGVGLLVLVCTILGFFTVFTFIVTGIILIVDLFSIPGITRRHNMKLASEIGVGTSEDTKSSHTIAPV